MDKLREVLKIECIFSHLFYLLGDGPELSPDSQRAHDFEKIC